MFRRIHSRYSLCVVHPWLIASRSVLPVLACLAGLSLVPSSTSAQPTPSNPGAWTPGQDTRIFNGGAVTAVHMALLPGDGQYHSKILWWQDDHETQGFFGGLWGWNPSSGDCSTWPSSSLTELQIPAPPVNIFCAGLSQVIDSDRSRLLVTGGTEPGAENGIVENSLYDPATNTWSAAPVMQQRRWYSTSTTLREGDRALVTSGSRYIHAHAFGGSKGGAASADSILRLGIVASGEWDPSIGKPTGAGSNDWPTPREGHTAVSNPKHLGEFYIGGLADGQFTNEVWTLGRIDGPQTPDYVYDWEKIQPPAPSPAARAEHTTVLLEDGSMVVFGGRGRILGQDVVYGDVWRLWRDPNSPPVHWRWVQSTIVGSPPSARLSHAAVHDAPRRRMLMFGGTGLNGSPSDDAVYALNFSVTADTVTWSTPTVSGSGHPAARYDHTLEWDGDESVHGGQNSRRAFLFGGKGQFGAETLSDELWILWINNATGALEWEQVTPSGSGPSRRSGHSTWYLGGSAKRLFVLGGETSAGKVGDVHFVTLKPESAAAWNSYQSTFTPTTNHTSILFGAAPVISRTPEVLTLGSNPTCAPRNSAYLWQEYYSQVFVAPGGRVFSSGPSLDSWRLDPYNVNAGWERYPASSGSGFVGGSAVMYRPGRVMKCGSRDTEGYTPATGTTKAINLNDTSPWAASDTMLGRVNHNLVILPTGQVLVVGGTRVKDSNPHAIHQPEIWDPAWNNWTGTWYGRSGAIALAPDTMIRGYHSTAILLPSGQVLCAGGNGAPGHQTRANIYCPPYLFDANGTPLARPRIDCAPKRVTYGQCFNLCTPQAATIQSACLIRPGAATHGFDQNQRYIPLALTTATNPARLQVTAPTSQDDAPAGDYLLFIVDGAGGNSVPAVGQWIRLATTSEACDATSPDAVTDFSPDIVSQNSIYLSWTAPGDDGSSGTAAVYDVRRSSAQITNESNFATSVIVDGEPPPQSVGTPELFGVTPLAACTKYYFGLRTLDEVCNPAALGNLPIWAKTLCNGGGGGSSAQLARNEGETGGSAERRHAGATGVGIASGMDMTASEFPIGGTIVETERAGETGWRIILRLLETSERGQLDADQVAIEERDATGEWRARSRMAADPSVSELGLCALRDRGRIVLPGGLQVQRVAGGFRRGPSSYKLVSAVHSALGSLDPALLSEAADLKLAPGQSLTLTYAAHADESTGSPEPADESWYLIAGRSPVSSTSTTARAPRGLDAVPRSFALRDNQPNPFSNRTKIHFDLPGGAMVRLEVFDLQGRRISILANRYFSPGYHAVEWDRSTMDGGRAGPGAYFCRIQAGPFQDRKKMVLLP